MVNTSAKAPSSTRLAGFTLIELLFIIVVVGILASIMILTYQQKANSQKVEKTAVQMQQIMQAAVSYKTDYNCWPNSTGAQTGCNLPNPPDFVRNYAPVIQGYTNGVMTNPWGGNYVFFPDSTQKIFTVQSGALSNDLSLANRIASVLPNATVTTTPTPGVTVSITQSGRNSYGFPGLDFKFFGSTGPINGTSQPPSPDNPGPPVTIPKFVQFADHNYSCPPNQTPHAAVMLDQIASANYLSLNSGLPVQRFSCPVGTGPIGDLDPNILNVCPGGDCSGQLYFTAGIPDTGNFTYFCRGPSQIYSDNPGSISYIFIGWCS